MLQEGLASSKHLRYPDAYLEGLLQQQELMEKRASMRGFQGMRGKKSAGDYYYNEPAYYAYGAAGPPDYYYDKRAPMGFQGMRGKKSSYDEDEGTGKRAPMGFQGMRGKKSLEEVGVIVLLSFLPLIHAAVSLLSPNDSSVPYNNARMWKLYK